MKALVKRKTSAMAIMNMGRHRNRESHSSSSPSTSSSFNPNKNNELRVRNMEPSVNRMVEYVPGPHGKPVPLVEDLIGIYY